MCRRRCATATSTRAVERLALMAQGIGGGTRIGESLATFNRWHARRVINSRTAVIIVSDGYDTGEPERLGGRDARACGGAAGASSGSTR